MKSAMILASIVLFVSVSAVAAAPLADNTASKAPSDTPGVPYNGDGTAGGTGGAWATIHIEPVIPDGSRLVIEYVSAHCVSTAVDTITGASYQVYDKATGRTILHATGITPTGSTYSQNGGILQSWTVGQSARLYSDAGPTSNWVNVSHVHPTNGINCEASVSGYLVPAR